MWFVRAGGMDRPSRTGSHPACSTFCLTFYVLMLLKYLCLFSGEGGHKEDPVPPDVGQEGEGIPGLEGDEGGAEGPEEPHLRL